MVYLSLDTQATLLLTAPLIAGDGDTTADILSAREYLKLKRMLAQSNHKPSDLLELSVKDLPPEVGTLLESERYQTLLERRLQLDQAFERWKSCEIWVVGPTDEGYPQRFNDRLKDLSPPVIYGCGNREILETGGLAVVGSRNVDQTLIEFTMGIGELAAQTCVTLVSGGARGIDQAAMRGALDAGGKVSGVIADSLERSVLNREHRDLLVDSRLVLISPYDPLAGFNIGHAMQRNKLIYALSDVALVVNSDYEKGGTWAGAVEQLEKLRFVPIYVRSSGELGQGLNALQRKGALLWPNPSNAQLLEELLNQAAVHNQAGPSEQLSFLEA